MLVSAEELPSFSAKVAMVDGGFDPLHSGHIEYFRAAADLGAPVLCNVSSDRWVADKHPPLLSQEQRGALIDAIRYITYTHLAMSTTEEVLRTLRPRYYVKGADWRDRLPEEQVQICDEFGIDVVFLDTVVDSSTGILERFLARVEH